MPSDGTNEPNPPPLPRYSGNTKVEATFHGRAMTRADELRQRAREISDQSWVIRFDHPHEARRLNAIAAELTEIAANLPPERAPE